MVCSHAPVIRRPISALALASLALAACTATPHPVTRDELEAQRNQDRAILFAEQEPVSAPISLYDAMARAIRYNLDQRQRLMEQALALRQLDVANYAMLPRLAASAGYVGRSNEAGSSSLSLLTGRQSLEPSTSEDRNRFTFDLTLTWNVLDFGVSYFRAQQQADRSLIAAERRRRAIHTILQDVRVAYWRAVAADRLLARIDPLIQRVDRALQDARSIEARQLQAPLAALTFQRALIDTLGQLHAVRRQLVSARTQLAALMNLPPGSSYQLAASPDDPALPELSFNVAEMEDLALVHRPELREEAYQARITTNEAHAALLQLLPGINLNAGYNYDSNSFLFNPDWISMGARVVGNLINLATGPAALRTAEAQEEVDRARRLALTMAVLTQLHVAALEYRESREEYRIAADLSRVDDRIVRQLSAAAATQRTGDLDLIQGELNAVFGMLRRDLAYAEAQNAAGRIFVSLGLDPLPETVPAGNLAAMANALRDAEANWYAGQFFPAPQPLQPQGARPVPQATQPQPASGQPVAARPSAFILPSRGSRG